MSHAAPLQLRDPDEPALKHVQPLTGWERWKFLVSAQWLGWFALACAAAVVCSMLGQWQLHRRAETLSVITKVTANYDREPVPFTQAADQFRTLEPSNEWLPVSATGQYLTGQQLVVRNRQNSSQNGYDILVPFKTTSGEIIAVDRGWIPLSSDGGGKPTSIPAPPSGQVTISVRLRPSEPALNRSAPEGQIATIELSQVASMTRLPVLQGAYGMLRSESPEPATPLTANERPSIDEGSHLSYAMQWFTFGLLAFIAFGYSARRHAIDVDEERDWNAELAFRGDDDADAPRPVAHPVVRAAENRSRRERLKRQSRTELTDEDVEDAYLDALSR